MRDYIVRIEQIQINNFKNVEEGKITLNSSVKKYKASILGLYGQNGSGKTALIDAIDILKYALRGQEIPASYADYIHLDAQYAKLRFDFLVHNPKTRAKYKAAYEFCIRKEEEFESNNTLELDSMFHNTVKYRTVIFDEILSYSYECDDTKQRFMPVVNTSTDGVFLPQTKYEMLAGTDKITFRDLLIAKGMAAKTSKSFVFSRELLSVIREKCEIEWHVYLFDSLARFGNLDLFVINTSNSGLISMNAMPLSFKFHVDGRIATGNMAFPLDRAVALPKEAVKVVEQVIKDMNVVLLQVVPGLTIAINYLGSELLKDGTAGDKIQLMSDKNSKQIPLKDESEGIKKIVSILHLLIAIYNDDSITVAIDELDAGIFEYLLGELLRIIAENGKGQLIFTSHNLRPLETLDKEFIAFTTINPKNRYIRFNYVKNNHNLRDFYYRDIILGEQSEAVYETTNNAEIAFAFREAGVKSGT